MNGLMSMDLLVPASLVDIERVQSYLREVMAMLSGLRGYLDDQRKSRDEFPPNLSP
jgi:hypothetical protein